jgi:uncharacterized delta-60 repeat protein
MAAPGASAYPGDLDGTFGTNAPDGTPGGTVARSVGDGGSSAALAGTPGPGATTIVVGYALDGGRQKAFVQRITAEGSLDSSFGDGGTVLIPAGTGGARAQGVAVVLGGNIVVGGYADDGAVTKVMVARVTPAGVLDGSFGSGGITLTSFGDGKQSLGKGVVAQGTGKVVVAGSALDAGHRKMLLARFTTSGTLDSTFGTGGSLTLDLGDAGDSVANGVTALDGGYLVAAGSSADQGATKVALALTSADGALQRSKLHAFGDGSSSEANAITTMLGKPVIAGVTAEGGNRVLIARFAPNLEIDALFGRGSTGAERIELGTSGNARGTAIAVTPGNRVVVGGSVDDGSVVKTALVRLSQLGEIDQTFGTQSALLGTVLANIGCDGGEEVGGLIVRPDGRIETIGQTGAGTSTQVLLAQFVDTQPGGGKGACGGTPPDQPGGGTVGTCTDETRLGPVLLRASCLRLLPSGRIEATGAVSLNGLVATTDTATKLIVDPVTSRIFTEKEKGGAGSLVMSIAGIPLFKGPIDWKIKVGNVDFFADVLAPVGAAFKGFPIAGDVKLRLNGGAVVVTLSIDLPKPFNVVTGSLSFAVDPDTGVRFDGLAIVASKVPLGAVEVRDLKIVYSDTYDSWEGSGYIVLPTPNRTTIGIGAGFKSGRFAHAEGSVDNANIALGAGVFLQKISFSITVDPLRIAGGVGISAGVAVNGISPIRIDGGIVFQLASPPVPTILRVDGNLKLFDVPTANAYIQYSSTGLFELGASIEVGKRPLAYANASVSGWLDGSSGLWSVDGSGTACVTVVCLAAEATINARWIAACAQIDLVVTKLGAGFAYPWGGTPEVFEGCDLGTYRIAKPSSPSRALRRFAPDTPSFAIAKGQRVAALKIIGTAGVPHVRVSGPSGSPLDLPATGTAAVRQGRFFAVPDVDGGAWHVLVGKPEPGSWSVAVVDGPSAVAAVTVAGALPAPNVKARVKGSGARRTLVYSVAPATGQTVRFVERGKGRTHEIARTGGGSKETAFTPSLGPGGRRTIVAYIEQDGAPRTSRVVASFVATAPAKPKAPGRVTISRRGRDLVVTFAAVKGAAEYELFATGANGERLYVRQPRAGVVRFAGEATGRAFDVQVRGIGAGEMPGAFATDRLAAAKVATQTFTGTVVGADSAHGVIRLKVGARTLRVVVGPATRLVGLPRTLAVKKGTRLRVLAEAQRLGDRAFALTVTRI